MRSNSFIKKFQNTIFNHGLFSKGDRIVVGISGGADSVCLARTLLALREKYDLELLLVHINYGLRGKDSQEDEKFLKAFSQYYRVALKVIRYGKRKVKGNLEEQLRDFRYGVFDEIRKQSGYDWIAVAHTMDDQAETFLMNLIRGAGLKGLSAMGYKSGKLIRPLLDFKKEEIKDQLISIGQGWREDSSNLDVRFLRSRLRRRLIPYLELKYNPKIVERLAGLAQNLRVDYELVEESGLKAYNKAVKKVDNGFALDLRAYNDYSFSQQSFVFRRLLEQLKGDQKNLTRALMLEFGKIIRSTKSKRQIFRNSYVVIERRGNNIFFKKRTK